ncbi:hypothetical protein GCM10009430_19230 [Aquimarina litoralis]|uniref:Uncharacterized protein n=1 Tax=Aquimarina litoralis TaxID=584605 RepID=A0ABP3TX95_9FLAO
MFDDFCGYYYVTLKGTNLSTSKRNVKIKIPKKESIFDVLFFYSIKCSKRYFFEVLIIFVFPFISILL